MGEVKNVKFGNILDMQIDEDADRDGVDISFGKGRMITIKRAGASNRKYKATMAKVFAPHQKPGGTLALDDGSATDLLKEVYAESVVIGWSGFVDLTGNEIAFSKANCLELFNESDEMFDTIQTEAAKFSNFARRDEEASGK